MKKNSLIFSSRYINIKDYTQKSKNVKRKKICNCIEIRALLINIACVRQSLKNPIYDLTLLFFIKTAKSFSY